MINISNRYQYIPCASCNTDNNNCTYIALSRGSLIALYLCPTCLERLGCMLITHANIKRD